MPAIASEKRSSSSAMAGRLRAPRGTGASAVLCDPADGYQRHRPRAPDALRQPGRGVQGVGAELMQVEGVGQSAAPAYSSDGADLQAQPDRAGQARPGHPQRGRAAAFSKSISGTSATRSCWRCAWTGSAGVLACTSSAKAGPTTAPSPPGHPAPCAGGQRGVRSPGPQPSQRRGAALGGGYPDHRDRALRAVCDGRSPAGPHHRGRRRLHLLGGRERAKEKRAGATATATGTEAL